MKDIELRNLKWLVLSLAVLVLDLWSKAIASSHLMLWESYPVMPSFSFTLAHNYGAAFSFLHDAGGWQRWAFAGIAILVSVILVGWLLKLPKNARFLATGLALLLGGAIGNLHDRMLHGYVVDFIHVYYGTWHFPAFNIADCGITVGTAMLIIDMLVFEKRREAANV